MRDSMALFIHSLIYLITQKKNADNRLLKVGVKKEKSQFIF